MPERVEEPKPDLDGHKGIVPDPGRNLPSDGLTPEQRINRDQQNRINEDPAADRM